MTGGRVVVVVVVTGEVVDVVEVDVVVSDFVVVVADVVVAASFEDVVGVVVVVVDVVGVVVVVPVVVVLALVTGADGVLEDGVTIVSWGGRVNEETAVVGIGALVSGTVEMGATIEAVDWLVVEGAELLEPGPLEITDVTTETAGTVEEGMVDTTSMVEPAAIGSLVCACADPVRSEKVSPLVTASSNSFRPWHGRSKNRRFIAARILSTTRRFPDLRQSLGESLTGRWVGPPAGPRLLCWIQLLGVGLFGPVTKAEVRNEGETQIDKYAHEHHRKHHFGHRYL
jgi:hypothetical protein